MMKKALCLFVALAAVCAAMAGPLDVKELKLKNGLTVWLNEDHSQPLVWGAVVVKAGGVTTPNEGIAHYFEHIMFKGTDQIGTTDYASEKPLLDSISACYDRLAQTTDNAARREIQKEINRLNVAAADYAIPNEFNRLINLYGGSGLNAATSYDFTMYFNTFSPQYMRQWLELNSHRLMNPVFRLFQGELEAVYEEKNMYADQPMAAGMEKAFAAWFGQNPYAYPIVGSTENLKNPQMSRMRDFYQRYYVAQNMALVLAGDFNAEDVEPWLESTFGRLPAGSADVANVGEEMFPRPQHHGETVEIEIPIPLVNIFILMFDYPQNGHADEGAMEIAKAMLSNESQTGLFDQLMTDKEALAVGGEALQLNHSGMMLVLAIPKMLASPKKLEEKIWQKIDSLKAGDFSDEAFIATRNSLIDRYLRQLEAIEQRGPEMLMTWASGKTWDEHMAHIEHLQHITRDDVVAAANRYLSHENFLRVVKKYGSPKHDKLSQPGYKPVRPKRDVAESDYAKQLRKAFEMPTFAPRLIDLQHDATKTALAPHANLYTVENPLDSLFRLSVTFYRGSDVDPMVEPLVALYEQIGTQTLSRKQLNDALLLARASMSITSSGEGMEFVLEGHDSQMREALSLLADLVNHPKADKESMSAVIDGITMQDKSFNTENTGVLSALISWLSHGEKSRFLNRATLKDIKRMTPDQLLACFDEVKRAQMSVTYSGTLPASEVERAVRELLPVDTPQHDAADGFRPLASLPTGESVVYFYNMKKARQALVGTYATMSAAPTAGERERAAMWGAYFGGDMSSVMFQELREYRSLGYTCGQSTRYANLRRHADAPAPQLMFVGTQADKTLTALNALDSIVARMPLSESNFEAIKSSRLNSVSHEFPSFRAIADEIAGLEAHGETSDPNQRLVEHLPQMTLSDIAAFHEQKVKTAPRVYFVIGDKKAIDMKALARLGHIVMVADKQIYKR